MYPNRQKQTHQSIKDKIGTAQHANAGTGDSHPKKPCSGFGHQLKYSIMMHDNATHMLRVKGCNAAYFVVLVMEVEERENRYLVGWRPPVPPCVPFREQTSPPCHRQVDMGESEHSVRSWQQGWKRDRDSRGKMQRRLHWMPRYSVVVGFLSELGRTFACPCHCDAYGRRRTSSLMNMPS